MHNMSAPAWAAKKWPNSDSKKTVFDVISALDTYEYFLKTAGDRYHKNQARLTGG